MPIFFLFDGRSVHLDHFDSVPRTRMGNIEDSSRRAAIVFTDQFRLIRNAIESNSKQKLIIISVESERSSCDDHHIYVYNALIPHHTQRTNGACPS